VNRRHKLVADIRINPRDVRFDDACRIAEWLGFMGKAFAVRITLSLDRARRRC